MADASRKMMVAGNWKMYKTHVQGVMLAQSLEPVAESLGAKVDIVLAPPATALHSVSTVIELDKLPMGLAAQNVHWEGEGAFTGEISCPMLTALRVGYVIIGHSERREYFAETDETVNRKVKAVCEAGMVPIVCCGETLETREAGATNAYVSGQIRAALTGLSEAHASKVVEVFDR